MTPSSTTETYAAVKLRDRHPALGRRAVLPAHAASASAAGSTEIAVVFKRGPAAPPSPTARDRRSSGRTRSSSGCSPTRASRSGSARRSRAPACRCATSPWTSATATRSPRRAPRRYERLILDVLLGDPPLFPRHARRSSSRGRSSTPSRTSGPTQGGPRAVLAGLRGVRSRADALLARDGRSLEAPMIIELPGDRQRGGRRRSSRFARRAASSPSGACSLSSSLRQHGSEEEAIEARERRLARAPPARHRRLDRPRRAAPRTPPRRRDPRGRRRRGEQGHRPARVAATRPPNAESLVTGLLLPDAPVVTWWPDRPAGPVRSGHRTHGAAPHHGRLDAAPTRRDLLPGAIAASYTPGDADFAWTRPHAVGVPSSPRCSTSRRTSRSTGACG